MSNQSNTNSYLNRTTAGYVLALTAILAVTGYIGIRGSTYAPGPTYLSILVLLMLFAVVAGRGVTGYWRGILIDSHCRMSLSRFQLLAWTVIVLSAILTAVLFNIGHEFPSPMEIDVPSPLWVLMGISTASAVGTSVVASNKQQRLDAQGIPIAMARHSSPAEAQWADLLMGDQAGASSQTVDLGKLQMLFFSFILVLSYVMAILAMFLNEDQIEALPAIEEGMNVLLGISHTGYLASQASTNANTGGAPPPSSP